MKAGNADVPHNLGYQWFFYHSCWTALDYSQSFQHGNVLMSTDSVATVFGAPVVFIKGLIEGKTKDEIISDVNRTHINYPDAGEPAFINVDWNANTLPQ